MVWEEALSKLAPNLGLSDVGLRKICKRHNIPLPPQGYWARSPERRSPKRTPLPQPDKDWDLEFSIPLQATPEGQNELDDKFGPQSPSKIIVKRGRGVGASAARTPSGGTRVRSGLGTPSPC